jgi:signal transduction histidine kinase
MVIPLSLFKKSSLVALLGLFLLAGFLATSVVSYGVSKANIRQAVITRELPLASDNIHSEIQRILLPPLNVSATMANDVFLRDWLLEGEGNVAKITDYLNTIRTRQNMSSAFLASDGTLNYYSYKGFRSQIDPLNGRDAWYADCKNGEPEFQINADIDTHVSNRLTLFINHKVFDYEGRFIGITGVATEIETIEALIKRFKTLYHKTIYFVSPSGRVAFRADDGTDPLEKPSWADCLGSQELAAKLLSQPSSTVEYQRGGQQILLNARFLPELKWYLVVEEAVNSNVQYLRRILVVNLSVCLLITLLVLTIVYVTVQQYQKRLLFQNETMSKQANALEENNRRLKQLHHEKDEFMKVVVHDLKTPLGGMVGLARLIQDENDAALILQYAEEIENVADEMMELVQVLLDLKEVESATTPELETLDLRAIVEERNVTWELWARRKKIRMQAQNSAEPLLIRASGKWVRIILDNLVSNAIKYSPEATQVSIRLESVGAVVRVLVADQGPGILPEERPLLFRQFSRLSSRPTAGETSSGLGLYIVKTMIEKLGGEVGVDSDPGRGSCFRVEFPSADADDR